MKGIIAFMLFSSAAIIAGGCGGSHTKVVVPSLYAGAWTGTWTAADANDGGTIALTIDDYGNLTGTLDRSGGLTGTLGGIVTGTGKWTATSVFTTSGNFAISGQMAANNTGINGNFTYWWNGTLYTGTFVATATTTTGTSPTTPS